MATIPGWAWFLVGLPVGACLGIFTLALLFMGTAEGELTEDQAETYARYPGGKVVPFERKEEDE